jgi:hypothetical protein
LEVLDAFSMELTGDRLGAARALARHEETVAELRMPSGQYGGDFLQPPMNRLLAARWLGAQGDDARALALLNYFQLDVFSGLTPATGMLRALSSLEAAHINSRTGSCDAAHHGYAEFIRIYDRPMPEHAHLVEEARGALEELRRGERKCVRR